MSVQSGIAFIARVRADVELRAAVEALAGAATFADLVAIAAGAGFEVTADDLREAHLLDWRMRWMLASAGR